MARGGRAGTCLRLVASACTDYTRSHIYVRVASGRAQKGARELEHMQTMKTVGWRTSTKKQKQKRVPCCNFIHPASPIVFWLDAAMLRTLCTLVTPSLLVRRCENAYLQVVFAFYSSTRY